jgi:hypothetical protein
MEKTVRVFSFLICTLATILTILSAQVPIVIGTLAFLGFLVYISMPQNKMAVYAEYVVAPAFVFGLYLAERADLKAHGIHALSLVCMPHIAMMMVLYAGAFIFILTTFLVAVYPDKFKQSHVRDI